MDSSTSAVNSLSVVGILFLIFFVIIIVVIIVWLYRDEPPPLRPIGPGTSGVPDVPVSPAGGSIINCAELGKEVSGPNCAPGTQEYGGICYTDVWSQNGGTKTAVCTVDWGPYGGVYTRCGIGIYYLNYGDPCTMVGPGYYKTAVCTCQYKGPVTASQYCQDRGFPNTCPANSDLVGNTCYSQSCPQGYYRTGRCTCSPQT